jgi:hypothetical protein
MDSSPIHTKKNYKLIMALLNGKQIKDTSVALDKLNGSGLVAITGEMNFSTGAKITIVDAPSIGTDATNKTYVDGQISTLNGDNTIAFAGITASLSAEVVRAQGIESSLETKVDFVIDNIDPVALDSLTEIVAAFQGMDGDILSSITNLGASASAAISQEVVDRTADVDAEQSRATAAELVLTQNLSAEVVRATADVNTEESRAIAAEGSLDTKVSTETSRATAAELVLTQNLSAEVIRATADVNTEESRAIAAELVLTNDLASEVTNRTNDVNAEQSRAEAAELVLTNDLSAEVVARNADVNAEQSRATAAELALGGRIDFIASNTAPEAIDSLTEIITAYTNMDGNLSNAIVALGSGANTALSAEIVRAEAAETSLDTYADTLSSGLSSELVNRANAVSVESSNRVSGDLSLDNKVVAETSRATAAELSLDAYADAISLEKSNEFVAEISNRVSGDLSLNVKVSDETSRATSAEAGLSSDYSTQVSAEVVARTAAFLAASSSRVSADLSLNTKLQGEITRATSSEVVLNTNLSSEIARATAAEAALGGRIDFVISNVDGPAIDSLTEIVTAYTNMDGDLSAAIVALGSGANTALSSEIARAEGIEAALSIEILDARQYTSDEMLRAQQAEAELQSYADSISTDLSGEIVTRYFAISAEVSNRISGDLALNNLISQEVSGEGLVRSMAIAAEVSRATAAEGSLDTKTSNTFVAEISSRTSGDLSLDNKVSAETVRAIAAEGSLDTKTTNAMSVEYAARISAETSLDAYADGISANLVSETSRAIAAELSLNTKVNFVVSNVDGAAIDSLTEIVTAFVSADNNLNGAITALAASSSTNVSTETARAIAAEASLDAKTSNAFVAEISNRISGDLSLDTYADAISTGLSTEVVNRSTAVSTETSRALAAETSLDTYADGISAELSNAIDAQNTTITDEISIEVDNREAADAAISAELSNMVASIEEAFVTENLIVTESLPGAGLSYTLLNSVEDNNVELVSAYINGLKVLVASVEGNAVTLVSPSYSVDSTDTVVFQYEVIKGINI